MRDCNCEETKQNGGLVTLLDDVQQEDNKQDETWPYFLS